MPSKYETNKYQYLSNSRICRNCKYFSRQLYNGIINDYCLWNLRPCHLVYPKAYMCHKYTEKSSPDISRNDLNIKNE